MPDNRHQIAPSRHASPLSVPSAIAIAGLIWLGAEIWTVAAGASQARDAGASGAGAQKGQAPIAPIGDEDELARVGEEVTEKACNTMCHNLEKLERRRTVRDWTDQVAQMVNRGAPVTQPQAAIIRQYLSRYYGLIVVNGATAEDFSAVLGFSAKDARAIVEYRTAHGKFADAAALAKVPGIDTSKLDEQPDALVFD